MSLLRLQNYHVVIVADILMLWKRIIIFTCKLMEAVTKFESSQWRHWGWCHPGRQLTVSPLFLKKMTFLVIALCKAITFLAVVWSRPTSFVRCSFLNSATTFLLFQVPLLDGIIRGGPPSVTQRKVGYVT